MAAVSGVLSGHEPLPIAIKLPSQSHSQYGNEQDPNQGPQAFEHLYPVIRDPVQTHDIMRDSIEMNSLGSYDSDVFEYGVDQKAEEEAEKAASNGYGAVHQHDQDADDSEMKYEVPGSNSIHPKSPRGSPSKHKRILSQVSQPGRCREGKGQSGVNWIQKMVKDKRYNAVDPMDEYYDSDYTYAPSADPSQQLDRSVVPESELKRFNTNLEYPDMVEDKDVMVYRHERKGRDRGQSHLSNDPNRVHELLRDRSRERDRICSVYLQRPLSHQQAEMSPDPDESSIEARPPPIPLNIRVPHKNPAQNEAESQQMIGMVLRDIPGRR